jgi:G3E family GTPase
MAIPVTVLTGFLGSGKTTLLNHLVRQPALGDVAVIVNEFGEIALDHLLIEHSEENIVLLRSGCLCCAVRGDLVETLRKLAARRASGRVAFSRVIIETTGLADPAPILHTLMVDPEIAGQYHLEGVAATVDAVNGTATLDTHEEAVKQVGMADLILLTKTDLVSPGSSDGLKRRLAHLNRSASIIAVTDGQVDVAEMTAFGPYDAGCKSHDARRWLDDAASSEIPAQGRAADGDRSRHAKHEHRHAETVRTLSIVIDEPVRGQDFSGWLELIGAMRGEQLLRLKGLVATEEHPDRPLVIHGVQHILHAVRVLAAWPSEDRRTRLVFITRDIAPELIEQTLEKFAHVPRDAIEIR